MYTEQQPIEYAVVDKSKKTKKKNEKQEKVRSYIHNWFIEGFHSSSLYICTAIVPAYADTYLNLMYIHIIM